MKRVARQAAVVFLCTLTVQVATFVVLALSGLVLSVAEFARLSIVVATSVIAVLILDFGMNVTMTKFFGQSGDEAYLLAPIAIRLLTLPGVIAVSAACWTVGIPDVGLGVLLGGALNIWNGVRASNQAREDYGAFARSSLVFAAVRMVGGIGVLFATRDAAAVAIATYAVPVLVVVPEVAASMARAFAALRVPKRQSVSYLSFVFLNQIAFSALPYIPQYFVHARLSDADVARYGLSLAFLAPATIALTSVRNVLLPKLVSKDLSLEDALWSARGAGALILFGVGLSFVGIAAAFVVEAIYQTRYPSLWPTFLILFLATTWTGTIGFYTLSAHTRNVPHYVAGINVLKLVVFLPLLAVCGHSLIEIAVLIAAVMIIGELVVSGLIYLKGSIR